MQLPSRPVGDTFNWILPPPLDIPCDAVWYVDGSLFDEARRLARRTGFGILIVSADGSLLAMGNGIPPDWVQDAAGAELWAVAVVLGISAFIPKIVTNC